MPNLVFHRVGHSSISLQFCNMFLRNYISLFCCIILVDSVDCIINEGVFIRSGMDTQCQRASTTSRYHLFQRCTGYPCCRNGLFYCSLILLMKEGFAVKQIFKRLRCFFYSCLFLIIFPFLLTVTAETEVKTEGDYQYIEIDNFFV